MTIDLYYLPPSPPARAAILLAKALGIHLNLKTVNVLEGEQLSPEFIKMNPQHTIPVINDHGFILAESRAIMGYLVSRYAKNDSLYPKDPRMRGLVDEKIYYDLTTLWKSIASTYIPVIFGKTDSPSEDGIASVERAFEILNAFLEGNDYVAGENLTIADFSIAISTHFASELVGFDIARYDNVASWYERCKEVLEKYGWEEVNTPAQALGEWYRANLKEEE